MIGPALITDEIQNEMDTLFRKLRIVVSGLQSLDISTINRQFSFWPGFLHSYGETPSYFQQSLQTLINRLSEQPG